MRVGLSLFACVGLVGLATVYSPNEAHACGGCLIPPGEQNSVVTDHRMVLSVSKVQSTLYDQIQYSGNPKEFAWVLPISGTVEVGLSADSMFNAFNSLSAVTVLEPPRNCPPPPTCPQNENDSFGARGAGTSSDAGAAPPIDVLKKETVGPYETVQLRVNDPNDPNSSKALENWLTANGFNIPADVQPIITKYVEEKFNFLALKLKPGEGTSSMRPVRVTTQGAGAVLPLRMVAAGTGANVGITLWVVSEGRYEPQNFPSFIIKDEDIVWDWNTGTSNFKALRAERSAQAPGKTWEIESSVVINRNQVENSVRNGGFIPGRGPQPGGDYLPIEDENGNQTKSADQVREEDLTTVFKGLAVGVERLTRMRADLDRAALGADLSIVGSQDQAAIPILRNPKKENGQPQCPIFDGNCNQTGTLPRDQAALRSGSSDDTFACSTTPRQDLGLGSYGALGAFLGLTLVRAARNRRKQNRF